MIILLFLYDLSLKISLLVLTFNLCPMNIVRGLKLTLPLKKEKDANAECGKLYIELDDLHITVADSARSSNHTSAQEQSTSSPMGSASSTNHVTVTPPEGSVRTNGPTSGGIVSSGLATMDPLTDQMNLISLDTPDLGRHNQGGGASTGSSRQPSPSSSPTPPSTGRGGGVAATAAAVTVGAASTAALVGGVGGSRTTSPPSQSQRTTSPSSSQSQRTSSPASSQASQTRQSSSNQSIRTNTTNPPPPPPPQQQPRSQQNVNALPRNPSFNVAPPRPQQQATASGEYEVI